MDEPMVPAGAPRQGPEDVELGPPPGAAAGTASPASAVAAPGSAAAARGGLSPAGAGAFEGVIATTVLMSPRLDWLLCRLLWLCMDVHLEPPLSVAAAARLHGLRWHFRGLVVASLAFVALHIWTLVDGLSILFGERIPSDCCLIRYWLVAYTAVLAVTPLVGGVGLPAASMLILAGLTLREQVPRDCRHAAPRSWNFVGTACMRGNLMLALATLAVFAFLLARRRLEDFSQRYAAEGPTHEVALREIARRPPPEVTPETECSICLGDGALLNRWRGLSCGHVYHEECLLEWLTRSRRCPLCRLDLHRAYLEP